MVLIRYLFKEQGGALDQPEAVKAVNSIKHKSWHSKRHKHALVSDFL